MGESAMDCRTLPQQIEARLIELIADGVLRAGEPLRLKSLCEEHGFTQMPLREALRLLASQGIVEYAANRGYRVPEVGIEDLTDVFEVRECLEGLAARLVAGRATEEQLTELEELAAECDRIEDTEDASAHSVSRELEFHRLIVEWCGNDLVSKVLLAANLLLQALLKPSGLEVERGHLQYDHRAVVQAIASGDPEQADSAARAHIREAAERIIAGLRMSIADEAVERAAGCG